MIRSLMLIVLLGIMVIMARGNPGALPEAARSAGAAIEDQIRKTASAAADPSPAESIPRPSPERRQAPSVEERPLPKPPASRPPTILQPATPPTIRNAGRTDDGPSMPAVPRMPVDEAPIGREPSPRVAVPRDAALPVAAVSTAPAGSAGSTTITQPEAPSRSVPIESLLRNAARILAETELPR